MAKRAAFLVQILDKIGAPLLAAIEGFRSAESEDEGVQDAQTLAALLGKAVQMSVDLSQNMDLKGSEEDADSVRLALAAMAGPLIAEAYKATKKVPDDSDLGRMNKALEAVLSFSDTFTPAATHISRLQSLEDNQVHADEDQNTVYVIQAFVPVLSAVAEFPFGQSETALVQEISTKLQGRANDLMRLMLDDDEEDEPKARYVELMILKSLAQIYAESHRAQTKKLIEAKDAAEPTMDAVWQSFDLKVGMLESLLSSTVPGGAQGTSAVAPVQEAAQPEASPPAPEPQAQPPEQPPQPQQAPPAQDQAASQPPASTPAQAPAEAPAAPAGGGGPMGFFKKGEAPQAATTQAPAAQPAQPAPQPEQQAPSPPQQPEQAQASPAPADGAPSSPMGFFKPGAKKEENSEGQ